MNQENEYEEKIKKLVNDMGFGRIEAQMALQDSHENIDDAIEKLLTGQYMPPPYYPPRTTSEEVVRIAPNQGDKHTNHVSNFLSDLTHRHKNKTPTFEDHPTAPPIFDTSNFERQTELKAQGMEVGEPLGFEEISGLPPPYEKVEKISKIREWEKDEDVIHLNEDLERVGLKDVSYWGEERCAVCFSVLLKGSDGINAHTMSNIVNQRGKFYHYPCFSKKFGPKCSYCCFPLSQADKDHDLSGQFLKYKNKDYHVECYEKYAGPRCSYCCNVIIERSNGEFSGNWIVDGREEFHLECYQKKVHAKWRAKNS